MPKGRVKWFSDQKGFGFIQQVDGPDVFCHFSDIQAAGFKTLKEGQEVDFELVSSEKGARAANVLPRDP